MNERLYLRITRKADGTYNISGSPTSLEVLASMIKMKAANPDNFFGTLKGHGSEVSITVPGTACPEWLKP